MSGFATQLDPNAAKAAEDAAAGGSGSYAPLPGGKYQVTIAKNKGVVDFANSGPNKGKKAVNLGFRIIDESPTGKGRYVWGRVPLFSRFAPNAKHPEGAVARAFWDFWEKALGVPRASILAGEPLPSEIGGTRLTITVSAPIPPDDRNPLGSNQVDFYDKAGDVNVTPRRTPGVPVASWLDANDNLIEPAWAVSPSYPAAAQQAAPAAPPAWGTPSAQTPAQVGTPWSVPQADIDGARELAAVGAGKGF